MNKIARTISRYYPQPQSRHTDAYTYRYGFSGQESDDGIYGPRKMYGYEFREYDTRLGRWWGIDPLSGKYPWMSPYAYCAGSPMVMVDPSGREKIDAVDQQARGHTPQENLRTKNACKRYMDNEPVIHLWAHGNNGMIDTHNPETGVAEHVENPNDMDRFLKAHSNVYQNNQEKGEVSVIVLHACQTGMGENNIAKELVLTAIPNPFLGIHRRQ